MINSNYTVARLGGKRRRKKERDMKREQRIEQNRTQAISPGRKQALLPAYRPEPNLPLLPIQRKLRQPGTPAAIGAKSSSAHCSLISAPFTESTASKAKTSDFQSKVGIYIERIVSKPTPPPPPIMQ
jgi:hypothetical protein